MEKRILDIIVLVGMVVLGGILFISTFFFEEATKGTTSVYIKVLGVSLLVLSAANILILIFKDKEKDKQKFILTKNPKKFFSFFVVLVLYIGMIYGLSTLQMASTISFFTASAIFIPITAFVLGYRKFLVLGIVTAGILLFIWIVFVYTLGVPLP